MKLVIVTAVIEFQKDILKLFKAAEIENFSSVDIAGYKTSPNGLSSSSWFPSIRGGNESQMFFSFTDEEAINKLLEVIAQFNSEKNTSNPIRGIVLPIEKFI